MSIGLAEYPSELDDYITLPNHKRLRIRALHRGEEGPIRELYSHLNSRTRYLRFFSAMPTLPESVARVLAAVDYRRQLALVAEHDDSEGREVVGLRSFGAIDEISVEVALVVRDNWQRQRIGTELAGRLLQAAESRGFHRFTAFVQPENIAIRRLLKKMGDIVSTKVSDGILELAFVRRAPTCASRIENSRAESRIRQCCAAPHVFLR